MKAGTAQRDITPAPGVELSGFAARVQPSTGVLDPLYAKAIYIETIETRLLWIHCDLIGCDRSIVESFRLWAKDELDLSPEQVLLSATHTHAGPATIHLHEAGEFDPVYVSFLLQKLRETATAALANIEPVELACVKNRLELAVDRRKVASVPDLCVAAFGLKRQTGTFLAVIINYPIHPVALGSMNRLISSDISGQASARLTEQLPGNPVVFMTNGASANLNPPAENVEFEQVRKWGHTIAAAVAPLLREATTEPQPKFSVSRRIVQLNLDVLTRGQLDATAERALVNPDPLAQWGEKYVRVVKHWRDTLVKAYAKGQVETHREAELFAIRLGETILLGVNAEVFSEFTDWLRSATGENLYVIGYANGDTGYLPTAAAYVEGGYEVDVAYMFYGGFRPLCGSLEILANEASSLISNIDSASAHHTGRCEGLEVPFKKLN